MISSESMIMMIIREQLLTDKMDSNFKLELNGENTNNPTPKFRVIAISELILEVTRNCFLDYKIQLPVVKNMNSQQEQLKILK